jgi:putative ABC transport system ATP-binding protein
MLVLQNISKYHQNRRIISNFSYCFEKGKMYAIVGPSGCGKTTLLNIISGQDGDYRGHILFNGKILAKDSRSRQIYRKEVFAYAGQFPKFFESMSAGDNLLIANFGGRLYPPMRDIKAKLEQPVYQLSGGERKTLSILQALMHQTPICLLDEPTNGLEDKGAQRMMDYMYQHNPGIVIFSTHNREMAKRYTTDLIEL